MNVSTQLSRQSSVLEAYRRILRLIHTLSAVEGTRLPVQTELIRRLDVCSVTLDAAMKWLVEDGVVVRKRQRGTFVLRSYPDHSRRMIWRVGLVMQPITRSYFGAVLAHYLHKHLDRFGISDRTYMLSHMALPAPEVLDRALTDFSGLAEDVDAGFLDAILTSTRLKCHTIPVCGVATWEKTSLGVRIDFAQFVRNAVMALLEKGCRNMLYVLPYHPDEWPCPLQLGELKMIEADLRSRGISFATVSLPTSGGSVISFERRFAEGLLTRPVEDRPDGLIIQDDVSAQAIAALLATTVYRPALAVQTNLQIPLHFALPHTCFALNLEQMAKSASELMLEKLLDLTYRDKVVSISSERRPANPLGSIGAFGLNLPLH